MLKFNLHNVTNTETKQKARVSYNAGTLVNGRFAVTVYAKDYGAQLSKMFAGVENDTDMMTDYFEKDRVRFYEGDEHFAAALAACEKIKAKRGW